MMHTWKTLSPNRKPNFGGRGQWPRPGEWLDVKGELQPCKRGLHLCRREDLVYWLGPEIWEAEYEGETVTCADKLVCRRARLLRRLDMWNEHSQRLFAADCAEHVLHLFEAVYPDDRRPREAIEVARRYAEGDASCEELIAAEEAAGHAAGAAASTAAVNGSLAAFMATRTAAVAARVTWRQVWAVPGGAAWAIWMMKHTAAERHWQTVRLFEYLYDRR